EPETLLPILTLRHLTDVFSHRNHDRLGRRPLREPHVAVLGAREIQRGNEPVGDVVLDAVPFAALVLLAVLGVESADAAVPLRHRKALAAAGLTFCKSHGSPLHVTDEWDARGVTAARVRVGFVARRCVDGWRTWRPRASRHLGRSAAKVGCTAARCP